MRKLMLRVLVLLVLISVPAISEALQVTIGGTTLTTVTIINGKPSIEISGTYTQGGQTFTISTCAKLEGCSGLAARVFVEDGPTVDNLVLTDAKITASLTNTPATTSPLTISFMALAGTGDLTAIPGNTYPYAVALSGILSSKSNLIDGTAWANAFVPTPCSGDVCVAVVFACAGGICGDVINTGLPDPTPSVQAPPFSSALSASFNKQETLNIFCGDGEGGPCSPSLAGLINVSLLPGQIARLPGSFNVIKVNVPADEGGVAIMAETLAALHPGSAAKILRASLEPSPGSAAGSLMVRVVTNTPTAWVVGREGNGESKTRTEVTIGGVVKVRAHGLCPEGGCAAMSVDVSVYCGDGLAVDAPGALELNGKGDGETTLVTSVPCLDPAVLIRDSSGWIAAPGLF